MTSPYTHLIKLYQLLAVQEYVAEKGRLENSLLPEKMTVTNFVPGLCCVCNDGSNLRNIHHKYIYEDEIDDYVSMFLSCFNIEIVDEARCGELCGACAGRLKDAARFRNQVRTAIRRQGPLQLQLQAQLPQSTVLEKQPWRRKCGSRTVFCTRAVKKIPVNVKPVLPRDLTACPVCDAEFDSHFTLVRHHSSHFLNYRCSTCGKGYHSGANYKRHLELHSDQKYPCQLCRKLYSTRDSLKQHVLIHHKKMKLYRCRKCPQRFSASSTRQKHMFQCHGVDCRRFACARCGKVFFTVQHHNAHVKRTHLNLRDHACPHCPSSFHTARELKLHLAKHPNAGNVISHNCCDRTELRSREALKPIACVAESLAEHTLSPPSGSAVPVGTGEDPHYIDQLFLIAPYDITIDV